MKNRPRIFRKLFTELLRLRELVWGSKAKLARRRGLGIECLEDRVVPAAVLDASMVDTIQVDADSDGRGDPGDTIRYTVTISNTGDADSTGTSFLLNEDTNAPLVANSVKISPRAVRDVYNAVGNTQLTGDIRANDVDIDGLTATSSLTITAINGVAGNVGSSVTLQQGGTVVVNANGTFTYTPQTGDQNLTESFAYSITDGDGLTGTGVVVFNLGQRVWYVDSTYAGANGPEDGSSLKPFNSLADITGATGPDATNDIIFVREQTGDYDGNLTLLNGQELYGSGANLTVNSVVINTAGSNTTWVASAPSTNALTLAQNNTVRGFTIGNTTGNMIAGTNFGTFTGDTLTLNGTATRLLDLSTGTANVTFTQLSSTSAANYVGLSTVAGTLNLGNGSLSGATGTAFLVTGGTLSATYSGNISQTTNNILVSVSGHNSGTITFQTGTLSATNASGLFFLNADGTYNFNGTTTLSGGNSGIAIISGSSGTFTFSSNTSITSPSGVAFNEDTSTANVTYNGTITQNNAANAVKINAKTGGTTTFAGSVTASTSTAAAVNLTNNTGGTVSFTSGSLGITTTSGGGFVATGGGTVNVTGANNTISSTTGTALTVSNTTIGASGLTFKSISANGGTNGIVLNTTGTSGGLTVTGTGTTDGSGGTIQNTTNRGATFTGASNIKLLNMDFTNAGTLDLAANNSGLSDGHATVGGNTNAAIHLQSVTNALLDNVNISGGAEQGIYGHTVANFTLANSTVTNVGNAPDEDNIHFFNMSGACFITNTTLTHTSGGGDDNLNLQTTAGNLDLVISGGSAVGVSGGVNQLGSGYLFGIRGTTVANISFENANSNNNFSGGIVADAFDNSVMNLRVLNTTSVENNDQLSVSAGDNSSVDLDVTGCTLSSLDPEDHPVLALLGSAFDNGYTFDARIHTNTITVANGLAGDGITMLNYGGGNLNLAVTNNTFDYAGTQAAMNLLSGQDGAATTRVIATGNSIDIKLDGAGNAVNGIIVTSGVADPSGAGTFADVSIGGAGALANTFTHSLGGTLAAGDIRVRQRFENKMNLDGYVGGVTDTAAVISYLNARNTVVSASTASAATAGTNGFFGAATPAFITVSVSAGSVLEDGGTNLVYTFTRTGSTAASLVANFAITGTATAGTDFTVSGATSFNNGTGLGTVTFAAGSATATITVDPSADATAEADESVVVDSGNSTTANGSFARAFISNDDTPLFLIASVPTATQSQPSASTQPTGEPATTDSEIQVPSGPNPGELSTQMSSVVAAAIARWEAAGLSPEQVALLHAVTISIEDLPGLYLGSAASGHITLDSDAAGHGWFIDPTPMDDGEYPFTLSPTQLQGGPDDQLDLLTTVMHELGHQLGLDDHYDLASRDDLMYGYLVLGERRLPAFGEANGAVPHDDDHGPDFQVGPVALGAVPFGGSIQMRFDTQVIAAPSGTSVTNQGTVTANGGISVLTDDPSVGGTTDANVTPLDRPDVTLAISATSVPENTGPAVDYTFTREGSTASALTINFSVGGTATLDSDYSASGADTFTASSGTITFAAGSSTAKVTITPIGDTTVEDDQTVILTVTSGTGYDAPGDAGYTVGNIGTRTGTIANDDSTTLTLSGGTSQNEGNSGTTSYTFTATLSNPVEGGFKVAYTTDNGSATAGSDYTDNDGTLIFTGTLNEPQTITVLVNGDNTVELTEDFTVSLGAISNTSAVQLAAITKSGSPQTGTITNDDSATVSIAGNVSEAEGTTQTFTVTLSNPVDVNVTVPFSTSDDTATAGSDYTGITNQTVTFNAGTTTAQTVDVTVGSDSVVEADEVFNVGIGSLSAGGRSVSLGTSTGTGTIENNDTATLTLSGGTSQNEGNSGTVSYTFTVTLNNDVEGGFDVAYTTDDGTATTANNDYQDNDGTLSFDGTLGESKTITVVVNGDVAIESDETFTVSLGTITNTTAVQLAAITKAGSPQTGTITTDDTDISIAVSPDVDEDGSTNLVYTFTRAGITTNALTVNFDVSGAATFNTDYTASSTDTPFTFNGTTGTVTFAIGATTATVTVDPTVDTTAESDEDVVLTLASGTGYRVVPGSDVATGTILDDDVKVTVAASPLTVSETPGTPIVYTFTRTGDTTLPLTANFSYGGTASDASDYTQVGADTFSGGVGTVTFAANSATAIVTLTPTTDTIVEDDETAILTVTSGTGYGLGSPGAATGTITNDDTATLTLSGGTSKNEGNSGTTSYTFTVTLNNDVEGGFDVAYTTDDDTATAGSDYQNNDGTLSFDGTLGESKTITVLVNGDNTVELTENFTVALGAISNTSAVQSAEITKSGSPQTGTITNDDSATVSIAGNVSEAEGTTQTFTVTLSNPVDTAVTVKFNTSDGTATTADSDYTGITNQTVTFNPGTTTAQTVDVTVGSDTNVENDEVFNVGIGSLSAGGRSVSLGTSTGTGTIENNDTATLTLSGGTSQNEGDSGTTSYTFTVTLNAAVEGGFDVAYTTDDDTATAGSDYQNNDGTLSFDGTAGESKTITVVVNGDNTVELDEAFTVALGALSNSSAIQLAAITKSGSPQTGTITNDDSATVSIAGNVSQAEATSPQAFTVTLSNPVDVNVTVQFSTSDGTATAGSDYTGITNQLVTFNAGSTTGQVVNVTVANDSVVEADEDFNVGLNTLSAGGRDVSLGTSTGTGTIVNNDAATLTLSGGIAQNEGVSGTTSYTFTVTLNAAVEGGFDVAYTTNDGTATTADNDYTDNDGTLSFDGTAGESKTITVLVNGDNTSEPDETFTVALGAISNTSAVQLAAITEAGSPQTGTITNDDIPPDTAIGTKPAAVTASTSATFTFTGSNNFAPGPLTFEASLDGGAFAPVTSPLTIPGLAEGSHTFEVRAVNSYGNADPTPASYTWIVDTAAPTASFGAPSATLTASGPVSYTLTVNDVSFVESSLTAGDFTLNKTGNANGTIQISGSGNTRTVTIVNITGNGTLGVTLKANSISDALGNKNALAVVSTPFNVDNTKPAVSISAPSAPSTSTGDVTYTITYSDTNLGAITLVPGDVTLNATGTATGTVQVSGSGNTRTVTITGISGDGTLGISLAANTATDAAGNTSVAAGPSGTFVVDNSAPLVSIGAPAVVNGVLTFTVTYTDPTLATITLAPGDVTLNTTGTANGTVQVSGSGNTRTVSIINLSGDGMLGISIAANTATDGFGRPAPAAGPSATFEVKPTVRYDMKASVSAQAVEGWNKAWQGTKYNATTGYGWSQSSSVGGGTNGLVPSGENTAVMGDYAYGVTTATFQVFVGAFQSATVNIHSYGTAAQGKPGVAAKIGNGPTSTLTTNGVLTISGQAGADGILNITFNRGTGKAMWVVSAIEVEAGAPV